MSEDDTKYVHGSADLTEHDEMFGSFITLVTRGAIVCIAILVFAALVDG